MMKFEWHVARLLKNTAGDFPGTITEVQWHVIGTDENGKSDWFAGAFTTGDPDPTNFIKFEDISKDQVLKWVKNYVETNENFNMTHIEEQIRLKIQRQDIEQVTGDDLPWAIRP